ncbi:hypothetical protein [Azospirillum sp. TSO22-1]|uniref:hypothetical protein n=1 Tax=Azospirillum sp. TSO22-1 TaxID=716789 RepID=UPI000D612A91|nr:hypothetical protein [Azospirillum sp. TSO22-1]PWC54173.1 hypothetical protein TSO221_09005 [Azospirillum sp. TSO22-1]
MAAKDVGFSEKPGEPDIQDGRWYALPWNRLAAVGGVSVLKFSYLSVVAVPVIAVIAEWLNEIPMLASWHVTPVHLSWPMALFFFGSVGLAAATLLQELCCPSLIKRYRSASDYRQSAFRDLQLDTEIEEHMRKVDRAHLVPQLQELADGLGDSPPPEFLEKLADGIEKQINEALNGIEISRERHLAGALGEWHGENRSLPSARVAVTWLYYFSAAIAIVCLLIIPTARVWRNAVFVERTVDKKVYQVKTLPQGFVCQLDAGIGGLSGLPEKGNVVMHCSVLQ